MTSFAKDLFDDLKESRLWPLAIALVVALVAIPVVLSKPAKEAGAPVSATAAPAVGGAGGTSLLPELKPIANLTPATDDRERKSVDRLARKNPFEPLVKTKSSSSSSSESAPAGGAGLSGTPASATGGGTTAGTTTGTTGGGSAGTSPSTGSDTAQTYYTYVAKVKFGLLGATENKTLQRMRAMPSTDNPIVVFLGATTDAETAVFLVSTSADPSGDGKCKPSDDQCTFLYMKEGETQTFDVADDTGALKTYELTLRKIESKLIETPTDSGANSSAKGPAKARAATGAPAAKTAVKARKLEARQKAQRYFQAIDRIGF
jgi:hypothetical protein